MTPLRQLIAKGGTRTFSKAEVEAERPTISELVLAYVDARERGDERRARAYQETVFHRLAEARRQVGAIEG